MGCSRWCPALFGAFCAWVFASLISAPALADEQLIKLGKRIYEQGVLHDGSPLTSLRLSGARAACTNCHRPSGYGSIEGRIQIPPIAGAVLFAPGMFVSGSSAAKAALPQVERFRGRSAYDEKSLARALRKGVDPDGLPFGPLMQHYALGSKDVSALAAYLRYLSDKPVPGMEAGTIQLATVVTPDVPPERRDAVLSVLRAYAASRGMWGAKWQLHVWQLAGPAQDWESQLAAYYRQQPVFALLSGVGGAEWSPVHRFCERQAIACILPSVDAPPERDGDYYSLYFSTGVELEAQLLAHHLRASPVRRLIQVVDDESGRRAAADVRTALDDDHLLVVQEMTPGEYALADVSEQDAAVFWLRPQSLRDLVAKMPGAPAAGQVFISALLADANEVSLPSAWKEKARYLSIFDPLAERRTQVTLRPWLARQGLPGTELRLRADAYAACNFFNNALTAVQNDIAYGIRGPVNRERVLEALESVMTLYRDDAAPFYWRMSLGPNQRIPVRGASLLRFASSESEELVEEEGRIVP